MAGGLLALLDDVAALVKVTAASLDDIPTQIAKTSGKVAGVVIDDAAVTPKYVVGLDPKRELSIIYHIARRSLINKIVFLTPAALLLGYLAPWAITPILMVGGAYLCFEGYEKLHAKLFHAPHAKADAVLETITPEELEIIRIDSAVRTDLILSSEIIAITYATVAERDFLYQTAVLLSIAVGITVAVYGVVGLIVKADDAGVHLAKRSRIGAIRALGRGLVKGMPLFLKLLGGIGTAAMLWVGAEIVAHGIAPLHHALAHLHALLAGQPVLAWFAKASICALGGLVLGALVAKLLKMADVIKCSVAKNTR